MLDNEGMMLNNRRDAWQHEPTSVSHLSSTYNIVFFFFSVSLPNFCLLSVDYVSLLHCSVCFQARKRTNFRASLSVRFLVRSCWLSLHFRELLLLFFTVEVTLHRGAAVTFVRVCSFRLNLRCVCRERRGDGPIQGLRRFRSTRTIRPLLPTTCDRTPI